MLFRGNQSELFGIALGESAFRNTAPPAPAFRASAATSNFSDSTTITLPTRVTGDYLFAGYCQTFAAGSLPSLNTGWSQVGTTKSVGSTDLALFTKVSNGTDSSPFSTNPMLSGGISIISVSGVTTGVDDAQGNTGSSSTNIVAPTATASGSADFQFCVYMNNGGIGVITVPGSQTPTTAVNDGFSGVLRIGYQTLSASGATGTRTATMGFSAAWAAYNVLVK